MYEDVCQHGYLAGSCAECRAARPDRTDRGYELIDHYRSQHAGKSRAQLDTRRAQCITRAAELGAYGRLSRAQADEQDSLIR